MEDELKKNRVPFSLQEALDELDLSTSEFYDFTKWANIATLIQIPPEHLVIIFYMGENLQFNIQNHHPLGNRLKVEYLILRSLDVRSLMLSGEKHISQFEAGILNTGEIVSPEAIHQQIYKLFLKTCKVNRFGNTSTKNTGGKIKSFYLKFKGVDNNKKWLSITPRPNQIASPLNSAPDWLTKSESLSVLALHSISQVPHPTRGFRNVNNAQDNLTAASSQTRLMSPAALQDYFMFLMSNSQAFNSDLVEYVPVSNKEFLFIASEIYLLKEVTNKFSRKNQATQSNNRLDILNETYKIFAQDILSIKDLESYWKKTKDTSKIAIHLMNRLRIPKATDMLMYCVKAVINDPTLLQDDAHLTATGQDLDQNGLPQSLTILNEVRNIDEAELPNAARGISIRRQEALIERGFKIRAAHNLAGLINHDQNTHLGE